jgi:hypothetical protein
MDATCPTSTSVSYRSCSGAPSGALIANRRAEAPVIPEYFKGDADAIGGGGGIEGMYFRLSEQLWRGAGRGSCRGGGNRLEVARLTAWFGI